MSQVSNTTSSIYLPGLTTTINAAVTQGLQTGITAQAIAAGGVSSMYMPLEQRIYSSSNWTRPANTGPVIKLVLVGGGGSGGCGHSWSHNGSGGGGNNHQSGVGQKGGSGVAIITYYVKA